jgi:hypothetical protein
VLIEALVRAVVVEMALVLVQDGAGMSLMVDQQSIGALLANRADESFGIAIRLRGPGRDLDYIDVVGGEDGIDDIGELGVPVADQKTERGESCAEIDH